MTGSEKMLDVIVRAPRVPEPMEFEWDRNKKVGEGARESADAFGYTGDNPTFKKGEDVLHREKPLHAAGIEDGDTVWLVDAGGGVGPINR